MTYPTDDPVRKLVMANLISSLEAIDGASPYRTEVKHVELVEVSALEVPNYPAVIVFPARLDYADDRPALITTTMTINMMAVLRTASDAFNKLYDLIEDVRAALLTDVTRGGNAVITRVEADDPFVPDQTQPFIGSMLQATIIYRHLRTDAAAAV